MRVRTLFPTYMVEHTWPDSATLNKALRKLIIEHNKQERGIVRSNAGGYHSNTDLAVWDHDCIKDLRRRIISMIPAYLKAHGCTDAQVKDFSLLSLGAWAMVNTDRDWGERHTHPGCDASGIYFVDSGSPSKRWEMNGWTEFEDPRLGANLLNVGGLRTYGRTLLAPNPGYMCLFPPWLPHHVRPFYGRGTRISIAFNISLKYKQELTQRRDLAGKGLAMPLQPPEAGQPIMKIVGKKEKAA